MFRRSSLHFIVFAAISLGFTIFVLDKAAETMDEINKLNETVIYARSAVLK